MRPTKAAQICEKTGDVRAARFLLGCTMRESAVCYLGIEVDDAAGMSEQIKIFGETRRSLAGLGEPRRAVNGAQFHGACQIGLGLEGPTGGSSIPPERRLQRRFIANLEYAAAAILRCNPVVGAER